jgi:RecA-family ATPase
MQGTPAIYDYSDIKRRASLIQPIPPSQLLRAPSRREWMVERCFAKATVAMLSGDGGIGKSLLMQQLVTCATVGLPWLGLAVTPGRGLFLGCEDDADELHRRQYAINASLGRDIEDTIEGGLHLVSRVGQDNILTRLDRREWRMKVTDLFAGIYTYCRQEGISYVVVDTATQTFGGNQNDEQQVVQFINQLRQLAIRIQGVVILTKHPSMTGRALGTGESGNTAWHNSVRSRLYLHQDKAMGLVLESRKSNYGRNDLRIPLKWESGVYRLVETPAARDYSEPSSASI